MNQVGSLVSVHGELGAAMFRKRPLGAAGVEVVCQLADGTLVPAGQLGAFQPYRRRYDVDVTDRFHSEAIALPALRDTFEFTGSVDYGWRVSNPVQVVSRGVYDGRALVLSALQDRMRAISRRHPVEECAAVDAEINATLGGSPITLPEGITIYRFSVRLTLDDSTRTILQGKRNVRYQGEIEQLRVEATGRALSGDNGLLLLHLTRHPDDTSSVIELITQHHKATDKQRIELIQDLVDRKIIQDVDLEEFARALVRQGTSAVQGGPGLPALLGPSTSTPVPAPPLVSGTITPPTAPMAAAPQSQAPTGTSAGKSGGVTSWKPVGKAKP
ncbi:hypothetical protein OHS18_22845 [Amycolatopsis sp. NBC_00355]|uniref:hypothetical protein n=1 Tax=Amycolatopsis sp. NBC_00355 TaxID=2975957 RepID=UPI002E2705C8